MNTAERGKRFEHSGKKTTGKREKMEKRLDHLLIRFIASALIFLLVFVGGRLIPGRAADVFGAVQQMICADLDLSASVEAIGSAVQAGESLPTALRDWCVDTFLPTSLSSEDGGTEQYLVDGTAYRAHLLAPSQNMLELKQR